MSSAKFLSTFTEEYLLSYSQTKEQLLSSGFETHELNTQP